MTLKGWRARSESCSIFWKSEIQREKILRDFQKRTTNPHFLLQYSRKWLDKLKNYMLDISMWDEMHIDARFCALFPSKWVFVFTGFFQLLMRFPVAFFIQSPNGYHRWNPRRILNNPRGEGVLFQKIFRKFCMMPLTISCVFLVHPKFGHCLVQSPKCADLVH